MEAAMGRKLLKLSDRNEGHHLLIRPQITWDESPEPFREFSVPEECIPELMEMAQKTDSTEVHLYRVHRWGRGKSLVSYAQEKELQLAPAVFILHFLLAEKPRTFSSSYVSLVPLSCGNVLFIEPSLYEGKLNKYHWKVSLVPLDSVFMSWRGRLFRQLDPPVDPIRTLVPVLVNE